MYRFKDTRIGLPFNPFVRLVRHELADLTLSLHILEESL